MSKEDEVLIGKSSDESTPFRAGYEAGFTWTKGWEYPGGPLFFTPKEYDRIHSPDRYREDTESIKRNQTWRAGFRIGREMQKAAGKGEMPDYIAILEKLYTMQETYSAITSNLHSIRVSISCLEKDVSDHVTGIPPYGQDPAEAVITGLLK